MQWYPHSFVRDNGYFHSVYTFNNICIDVYFTYQRDLKTSGNIIVIVIAYTKCITISPVGKINLEHCIRLVHVVLIVRLTSSYRVEHVATVFVYTLNKLSMLCIIHFIITNEVHYASTEHILNILISTENYAIPQNTILIRVKDGRIVIISHVRFELTWWC